MIDAFKVVPSTKAVSYIPALAHKNYFDILKIAFYLVAAVFFWQVRCFETIICQGIAATEEGNLESMFCSVCM